MLRIELLVDARNELGEGPLWDVEEQRLYWIDSHGRLIQRCDARGEGKASWCVPEHIGSMCLRAGGGAIVSLRNGFHSFDFRTGAVEPICDPEPERRRTRMNDGKVDRQGRFLAGYMDYEEKDPLGGLYRLDADLKVTGASSSPVSRSTIRVTGPWGSGACFSPHCAKATKMGASSTPLLVSLYSSARPLWLSDTMAKQVCSNLVKC